MHDELIRLTRRQKRRIKRIAGEAAGAVATGVVIGGTLIWAIANDDYQPTVPEHYGQIEYCGVWWDADDYEAMMAEREEYLAKEQSEAEQFNEAIRQAQDRYEKQQEQDMLAYREAESQPLIGSMDWDTDEAYMLAKISMAEAEGEDTEGKALVILVVLNRVWSDEFPDTIEEVITQKKQFAAYENGRYDRVEPNEDCYRALELVQVSHWNESQNATYFERTTDEETWHNSNLKKLFTHGNHTFFIEE